MKELKIEIPDGYEIDEEKSSFTNIVFKKKVIKLPKTWEEFCEQNPSKIEYYIDNCSIIKGHNGLDGLRRSDKDRNLLSTIEDAEAHLALIQLHRLRDVYRQGWKPDYSNINEKRWVIYYCNNTINITDYTAIHRFLSFPTKEIAEQFLENFKNLIELAKELI